MLVIRRRPGESLVLSGGIEIILLDATSHGVKLGITAPAKVTVLRKEIYLAQETNRIAAETAKGEAVFGLIAPFRPFVKKQSQED
jgi:carbon storage regulator